MQLSIECAQFECETHGTLSSQISGNELKVHYSIILLLQDVLILSQFVRPDGCMMPRRITGLSRPQQKIMSKLVSMAHKAGNT